MTAHAAIDSAAHRAKLTARDFWLLAEAGAFDRYAKSELIEGEIWAYNAIHSWHARMVAELSYEFTFALRQLGSPLKTYASASVDMSDDSVPEPDVSIGDAHSEGPVPLAKTRLAVEVSDTTLDNDLTIKAPLYARHGVPEYWVVSRDDLLVYRHWSPSARGYAQQDKIAVGSPIASATIEGLSITTPLID